MKTEKQYVGQCIKSEKTGWCIEDRRREYIYKARGTPTQGIHKCMKEDLDVHGNLPDWWVFKILHEKEFESVDEVGELEDREIVTRNLLNDEKGYNRRRGGRCGQFSENTLRLMSEAQRGDKHWNWGGSASDETRQKMSKRRTGMKHTEETKKAIGDAHRGVPLNVTLKVLAAREARRGTHRTPESCAQQSTTMIAANRKGAKCAISKKVDQFSKEGVFIKTWESLREAGNEYGTSGEAISNCIRKLRKGIEATSAGYKWAIHVPT